MRTNKKKLGTNNKITYFIRFLALLIFIRCQFKLELETYLLDLFHFRFSLR